MSEEGRRPAEERCGKGERARGEERSGARRPQANGSEKQHGGGKGRDEPVDGDGCRFGKEREVSSLVRLVRSSTSPPVAMMTSPVAATTGIARNERPGTLSA